MAEGVKKAIDENGAIGIIKGGLESASAGISAAVVFGLLFAIISKSRDKS